MLTRVLTLLEFCAWYKFDRRTVVELIASGDLPGAKIQGRWRIPDIGPVLVERARQQRSALETVPLLRGVETAQLLQVSARRVRAMAAEGKLPFTVRSGRRLYALTDILAAIKQKKSRNRRENGSYARPNVLAWAKMKLAEMAEPEMGQERSSF